MRGLILAISLVCLTVPLHAKEADIAILGGTVVDGTGKAQRKADVLITGDKISFIGKTNPRKLKARRVINATGRIVTPGFIDTHAHGNPLADRSFDNFLLQGATTVVIGQDGVSPQDESVDYTDHLTLADWLAAQRGETVKFKGPVTLAQWIASAEKSGVEVNIAPLSGMGTNRMLAGARTEARITAEQMAASEEILKADLAAGAYGLSSGLEYVPGRYAENDELVRLARITGAAGGIVVSHMRSEDNDKIEAAIDELIAQAIPARVHISHLKIVFAKEGSEADAVLDKLARAKRSGIQISADVYPYYAGYADMTLVYPSWAKRREQWEAALATRRNELEQALVDIVNRRNGPEAILISSGQYKGKTLKQIADELHLPFVKVLTDVFGYGGPSAAHRIMLPEVQDRFITASGIAIASDGGPWINHPRSWGTYPQMLQSFVRERELLSIEAAVYKMSGLPAQIMQFRDRGVLKKGNKADILVIDMAKLVNNASWTKANAPPSGYDAIIVNGAIAVENGTKSDRKYGQILRRAGGGK